jgi:hypothetical protein
MIIAGIDYSMTSPAVCVFDGDEDFNFQKCRVFYYTTKPKYAVRQIDSWLGYQLSSFLATPPTEPIARYEYLSDWALPPLLSADYICIEDYAYGAKGQVFNIGENTGILKYRMWQQNKKYSTVAPTQVKKFATGKGNANKEAMHDAFATETGINLMGVYKAKGEKIINPVSDIVDAYYICKYGHDTYINSRCNSKSRGD